MMVDYQFNDQDREMDNCDVSSWDSSRWLSELIRLYRNHTKDEVDSDLEGLIRASEETLKILSEKYHLSEMGFNKAQKIISELGMSSDYLTSSELGSAVNKALMEARTKDPDIKEFQNVLKAYSRYVKADPEELAMMADSTRNVIKNSGIGESGIDASATIKIIDEYGRLMRRSNHQADLSQIVNSTLASLKRGRFSTDDIRKLINAYAEDGQPDIEINVIGTAVNSTLDMLHVYEYKIDDAIELATAFRCDRKKDVDIKSVSDAVKFILDHLTENAQELPMQDVCMIIASYGRAAGNDEYGIELAAHVTSTLEVLAMTGFKAEDIAGLINDYGNRLDGKQKIDDTFLTISYILMSLNEANKGIDYAIGLIKDHEASKSKANLNDYLKEALSFVAEFGCDKKETEALIKSYITAADNHSTPNISERMGVKTLKVLKETGLSVSDATRLIGAYRSYAYKIDDAYSLSCAVCPTLVVMKESGVSAQEVSSIISAYEKHLTSFWDSVDMDYMVSDAIERLYASSWSPVKMKDQVVKIVRAMKDADYNVKDVLSVINAYGDNSFSFSEKTLSEVVCKTLTKAREVGLDINIVPTKIKAVSQKLNYPAYTRVYAKIFE